MRTDSAFGRSPRSDRRGIALIMVMLVVSTLMIIGILFSGSVTAEYRASVYYRQAIQSEQYCVLGMHRAMAELMYDVWGVDEHRPFESARYSDVAPNMVTPDTNLRPLGEGSDDFQKAAYYESSSGTIKPIIRQSGFWNGEAWVVWAGTEHAGRFAGGWGADVEGTWNMDPRATTRQEKLGGAQRYISFGEGTVAVENGSTAVTGTGTHFDTTGKWVPGGGNYYVIYINGVSCQIQSVASATQLTLRNNYDNGQGAGLKFTGLGWAAGGSDSAAGSMDENLPGGQSLPGGPMALGTYIAKDKGYAANPRWVNPEGFIGYTASQGDNFKLYGGVDINGDGQVNETDKALRNWALWKLKCDAFLPEGMDNNDLFENQMHANNRLRWGNPSSNPKNWADDGYEFISPLLVGDSFYQVFRFDPIYTMYTSISGESASQDILDSQSNTAGYRYPYDRTHLGRYTYSGALMVDDVAGGLVNINQVNNNYSAEEWTSPMNDKDTPTDLTWYHINEAKWIYCYDPLDANRRFGRYAVTVQPDCATWNASALQNGMSGIKSTEHGCVAAAGGMLSAIDAGFNPKTGDQAKANLLARSTACLAPIRPEPLPPNWSNMNFDSSTNGSVFCAEGNPDITAGANAFSMPPVDYTRASEIGYGPDRTAVYNYLMWLGPYNSRAEFATHLRKAGLVIPALPFAGNTAKTPADRRCMETDINADQDALDRVARDAQLIAAQTTVNGYYYTLDRFWDRNLLFVNWERGTDGSDTDTRVATAQCSAASPVDVASAGNKPAQKTRTALLRQLNNLECFGGYRTRDGRYRLLDYLFNGDSTPADYLAFANDQGIAPAPPAASYTPSGYSRSPVYGGLGTLADPATWNNQKFSSRREKFLATTISRIASMQYDSETSSADSGKHGKGGVAAACANGHLVHMPRLSAIYTPVWNAGAKSATRRLAATDVCDDEIGAGCPVCGGKLYLAIIHESGINEVGRFYGKFRNAERPARTAWKMRGSSGSDASGFVVGDACEPASKPMRHFLELMAFGGDGGCNAADEQVRYDRLGLTTDGSNFCAAPAILADPSTGGRYFTSSLEYDQRWRKSSDDSDGIDPEPVFRNLSAKGSGSQACGMHILVYDDNDNGGRWHDVTWCVDNTYVVAAYGNEGNPGWVRYADWQLYTRKFYTDDINSDSGSWGKKNLSCDEYYAMPDPDPAHRQAGELAGGPACVSIYRKMPVRWAGGHRRGIYYMHYQDQVSTSNNHHLPYWNAAGNWRPLEVTSLRGLGFSNTAGLCTYRSVGADDALYAGDDIWPPTAAWLAAHPTATNDQKNDLAWAMKSSGLASQRTGWVYRHPEQYGVVSFDSKFDGSKVAVAYGYHMRDESGEYTLGYRVVSYVELTDSNGKPMRISETCGREGNSYLSWQARNPKDTRGNGDGYIGWDLLPMTLSTTYEAGYNDPVDKAVGCDPWWLNETIDGIDVKYGHGITWWCAADDGFSSRLVAQGVPTGYADLAADGFKGTCKNRNANMWNLNFPVRRSRFDGTTATSKECQEGIHESLIRTLNDNALQDARWARIPNVKEHSMSIPTGVGRQVTDAEATDAAAATYAGRQYSLPGTTWHDGIVAAAADSKYRWAAYTWSSMYKIYDVTDLCQELLWNVGDSTEHIDFIDANEDGRRDELATSSTAYQWDDGGAVADALSFAGSMVGELRQINKLNLNDMWYPPTFSGVWWNQSYTSFGRKPLKGFHSPSDANIRHYVGTDPGYNLRVRPWDLDADISLESDSLDTAGVTYGARTTSYYYRYDSAHCGTSPVYTLFVTGNALDEQGEPLAEMRMRATVERTWDGRCNVLEFCWLPADRGFMDNSTSSY